MLLIESKKNINRKKLVFMGFQWERLLAFFELVISLVLVIQKWFLLFAKPLSIILLLNEKEHWETD
jgi:hypothetical protein